MTLYEKYSDSDWDEIPAGVQKLWEVLGYTEKLWAEDKTPPACDEYWKKLTPEQQAAATELGYTEESWDAESDSESESSEE